MSTALESQPSPCAYVFLVLSSLFALWAYRTSIPTNATPFSLVYGMEAVLPIEIEIPSLRISLEGKLPEEERHRERLAQLELLDEKRLRAAHHAQIYQRRIYHKKGAPL